MTTSLLQPQTLPPANDGHVRSALTADERLLRKAVARCFKAQVAEVHGRLVEGTSVKGGPGSGNFGHAGRPGEVGGSGPGQPRFAKAGEAPVPVSEFDKGMREKEFVMPKRAKQNDAELVWVDVKKFEEGFKKNDIQYIGEGGTRGISNRYSSFAEYYKANKEIEVSEVVISKGIWEEIGGAGKGTVQFINGRHRYAYMRDQGATTIPVALFLSPDTMELSEARKEGIVKEFNLKFTFSIKGGPGSGNFGHEGRPGEVGGSGPGGSGAPEKGSVILYHGTKLGVKDSILKEGIKARVRLPDGRGSGVWMSDDLTNCTLYAREDGIIFEVRLSSLDVEEIAGSYYSSKDSNTIPPNKITAYYLYGGKGHVQRMDSWERYEVETQKGVSRLVFFIPVQIVDIGSKSLKSRSPLQSVPSSTKPWDEMVMREVRPIWFGLFKKGGDKALKSVRKFPKHAKKMAVLGEAEMRASERVEVVEKGGPGSGNFGHVGRPGEVGGSGGTGSAHGAEGDIRTWDTLPKLSPSGKIVAIADQYGLQPDWREAPKEWGHSATLSGTGKIAIQADSGVEVQLHELGHVLWNRDHLTSDLDNSMRNLVQYAKQSLPIWDAEKVSNPESRWRVLPNGERIDLGHGDVRRELFSQLFSAYHAGKLEGDWKEATRMLLLRSEPTNKAFELLQDIAKPPYADSDYKSLLGAFQIQAQSILSLKSTPSIVIPEWIEDPDVLDALEAEMFEFAHNINQATADMLREELLDGMENGETISQLKNRISDISDEWVEGYRSERIARTETARAFSIGHIEAWRSTGAVNRKVWSTAGDCCPFCAELEGVAVGLDENFFKLGDEQTVEWRGKDLVMAHDYSDIKGPPLHPNCRCALIGELIDDRKAAKDGDEEIVKEEKGGPGSGNFGHEGRPGEVGGSGPGGDISSVPNSVISQLKSGEPAELTLYHGTRMNFDEFDSSLANANTSGLTGNMILFTDRKDEAEFYTKKTDNDYNERVGDSPQLLISKVQMENPLVVSVKGNPTNYYDTHEKELLGDFDDGSHDAIIIRGVLDDGSASIVVSIPDGSQAEILSREQKSLKATPSIVIPKFESANTRGDQ